jgi:hypothetical protein
MSAPEDSVQLPRNAGMRTIPANSTFWGVAVMVLVFFASKRIEKQRLKEDIEKCRLAFRGVNTVAR